MLRNLFNVFAHFYFIFQLSNAGQWVRLVPSLSGTLYRFCGESLEPINLSVDQLLSSSYKFSDDLAIAG